MTVDNRVQFGFVPSKTLFSFQWTNVPGVRRSIGRCTRSEGSQAKTGGEKAGREKKSRRIGSILIETGAK